MFLKVKSLRWRLTWKITGVMAAGLTAVTCIVIILQALFWYKGNLYYGTSDYAVVDAVASSIDREQSGSLTLKSTPQLLYYIKKIPDFWFVAQDGSGGNLQYGNIPESVKPAIKVISTIAYADLVQDINKSEAPVGTIQWAESPAGQIKIMTSARTPVTFLYAFKVAVIQSTALLLYMIFVVLFVIPFTVPFVVKKMLSGMNQASDEASRLDFDNINMSLSRHGLFSEILPFVDAINSALRRLEDSYRLQKQFLADAAHELRTPIATINTRLSGLPSGDLKTKLVNDTARLTSLTNNLLDLERYQHSVVDFEKHQLTVLAESVVTQLAPLAANAGYDLCLDADPDSPFVEVDPTAIERALRNLIQNAISYGGGRGDINVRVYAAGYIDVSDQGEGIPEGESISVFQPFHRIRNDGRGTGLGLPLVSKIMKMHGGTIELLSQSDFCGACFRMNLTECVIDFPSCQNL